MDVCTTQSSLKSWRTSVAVPAVLLTLACIWLVGAVACDPGHEVTYVNETSQTMKFYLGDGLDDYDGTLAPGSSWTGVVAEVVWEDAVVIRDVQDNVLYREELTWEEFKERDYRFVVTEDMIGEPPSSGP